MGAMWDGTGMLEDDSTTDSDIGTPLDDSKLYLYTVESGAPSATHVAYNDDGNDLPAGYNDYASRIVYTATYTGTHFAKMVPYDDGNAGSFDFIFDSTCLISQRGCEEDGGTFGVCSTAPGLETKLKCTQAAEGYSLDDAGTVKVSRTIFCDSDSSEGDGFCTSLVSQRQLHDTAAHALRRHRLPMSLSQSPSKYYCHPDPPYVCVCAVQTSRTKLPEMSRCN